MVVCGRGSPDCRDGAGEMLCPAIGEIVAINGCDDRMVEPHARYGLSHLLGLVPNQGIGQCRSLHCRRRKLSCRCRP